MIPEVTIGFPVYNVERYVEKSLLSALEQDFSLPYEILVIDDCGNDCSMEIVQKLQSEHPKGDIIRVIRHEHNKGLGPARNTVIDNAKGKYLLFLDSDDWFGVDALSKLYAKSIETNSDVTVGSIMDIDEKTLEEKMWINPDLFVERKGAGAYIASRGLASPKVTYWNKLFLTDFVRRSNMYCTNPILEDVIPDFRAKALSTRVAMISDVTLFYNVREGSIMRDLWNDKKHNDKAVANYLDIIKRIQTMVRDEFRDVDGIYDMYFAALLNAFGIMNAAGIKKDYPQIAEIEGDFMNLMPSFHSLYSRNARLVYLLMKGRKQTIESFCRCYEFACSKTGRLIKLMLGKL